MIVLCTLRSLGWTSKKYLTWYSTRRGRLTINMYLRSVNPPSQLVSQPVYLCRLSPSSWLLGAFPHFLWVPPKAHWFEVGSLVINQVPSPRVGAFRRTLPKLSCIVVKTIFIRRFAEATSKHKRVSNINNFVCEMSWQNGEPFGRKYG